MTQVTELHLTKFVLQASCYSHRGIRWDVKDKVKKRAEIIA